MKYSAYIMLLYLITSCAEPFNFEQSVNPILVVDARLSTNEGETLVAIYENSGETRKNIDDFQVNFIDSNGDKLELAYLPSVGGYVLPSGESALTGESYFLNAIHPDGYTIASLSDSIGSSADFDLIVKDSVYLDESNAGGQLAKTVGKAIQVSIQAQKSEYYARISYRNTYQHYYSLEVNDRTESDFLYLFSCEDKNCNEEITETIRLEKSVTWFFELSSPYCDSIASWGQRCQGPECCTSFLEYETLVDITMETISKKNYQFWKEIESLRSNDGLVFDTFPFPFDSNLSCDNCPMEVIGNFRVTSEKNKSMRVLL
ncbi:MAG: DUF4249 family protein [Ekhidna sp.]